jgi:uncharacterized protein (DUF2164 family)
MKQEITISPNCVVISENNDELVEELLAELFVEFINTRHGKQVVEKKL